MVLRYLSRYFATQLEICYMKDGYNIRYKIDMKENTNEITKHSLLFITIYYSIIQLTYISAKEHLQDFSLQQLGSLQYRVPYLCRSLLRDIN